MGLAQHGRSVRVLASVVIVLAIAGCIGAASDQPDQSGLMQSDLSVGMQVLGEGNEAALLLTWTNRGHRPVLVFTHVDTDNGPMFDAIEVRQGLVRSALRRLRKAAAPRFCVLRPGDAHVVRVERLHTWLNEVGVDTGQPWRADYFVDDTASAPRSALPLCGASGARMPDPPALWRGRVEGPLLRF